MATVGRVVGYLRQLDAENLQKVADFAFDLLLEQRDARHEFKLRVMTMDEYARMVLREREEACSKQSNH